MTNLPYRLEAYAKGAGRPLRPFTLQISSPRPHEEFGYQCNIECPIIREQSIPMYGCEPLFAAELCIQFVRLSLDHLGVEIVDKEGRSVLLPKFDDIPEEWRSEIDDDGAREDNGVLVSLKDFGDGELLLCIDDLHQSAIDGTEIWNARNSFTLLPLETEISEKTFAQIGWNIVTRLYIRRVAAKNKSET